MPLAIQKGVERAKKDLFRVPKHGSTITHQTTGIFGSGRVLLKPASPGTGVIAGGGVRAVLELAGIHDILSKSLGTQNPINLVKATVAGLRGLRTPEEVGALRGLTINQVLGLGAAAPRPEGAVGGEAAERRRRPSAEADAPGRRPNGTGEPAPEAPARGHRGGVMASLTVTQRRSRNGANTKQLDTLRSLGLRRIGHTVAGQRHPPGARHAARGPPPGRGQGALMSPAAEERDAGADRPAQPRARARQPPPAQAHRPRRRVREQARPPGAGRRAPARVRAAKSRANFEGGQMPIHMRMRKLRGPHMKKSMPFEPFRTHTQPVNVVLAGGPFRRRHRGHPRADAQANGLATRKGIPVKILAKGELTQGADRARPRLQRRRPPAHRGRRRHLHGRRG